MKQKVALLVFDGFADWEPALALCEICRSGKFAVVTAGFTETVVTTMGGLRVVPETTIDGLKPAEMALFIMPGGDMWEQKSPEGLIELLHRLQTAKVPIAAICGATLEIARAGLTRGRRHTSNFLAYLKAMVPGYRDEEFYVNEMAVTDLDLITASGLGSVEFGREVIKRLSIYNESDTREWFEMYKHGVIPTRFAR